LVLGARITTINNLQNRTTSVDDDDDDEEEDDVEVLCKYCQHKISLHNPKCSFVLEEEENENEDKEQEEQEKIGNEDVTEAIEPPKRKCCDCETPEFYNAIISGKYFGWIEIHCNSCGKLLCYIDSSTENVYDFKILCKKCIVKKH